MALINTTTTGIQGSTFYADGTGDLTIQQNGQTIAKVVNQPAFSAYMGTVSFSHNTNTKIPWSIESYDTASCYDNVTNYRFTPNVAGYYYTTIVIRNGGTSTRQFDNVITIRKNGSTNILLVEHSFVMGTGQVSNLSGSAIVYLNGTTDYLESYFLPYDYTSSGSVPIYGSDSIFQACLIRSA